MYWEIWTHRANIPMFFYNIVNIQSFGIGLLDIDDHHIDHPIITNNKEMPDFPSMH
jgi:hypothetical protein